MVEINKLSSSMLNGTAYIYVELVNDIDITNATGTAVVSDFRGSFDGSGYTIKGTNNNIESFFSKTYNGTVIKNINIDVDSLLQLVYWNQTDSTLVMSDIVVYGVGDATMDGTNVSPFIGFTFGNLTMERCINHANLVLGDYGAVFLGGYVWHDATVIFSNSENHGDVMGDDPSLFIGNPHQTNIGSLVIEGCVNTGIITGTSSSNYICAYGSSYGNVFTTLSNACSGTSVSEGRDLSYYGSSTRYAYVDQYHIEPVTGDGSFSVSTITADLSGDSANGYSVTVDGNADYVVFSISAYAQWNGTMRTTLTGSTVILNQGSADLDFPVGMMTTLKLAETEYGVSTEGKSPDGYANGIFPWYSFEIGGVRIYAVDFGDTQYTLNDVTTGITLSVSVYQDGNSTPVAYDSMTVSATKPDTPDGEPTSYHRVHIGSSNYLVVNMSSEYVADGASFTFTLTPVEGYEFTTNPIISIYDHYDEKKAESSHILIQ